MKLNEDVVLHILDFAFDKINDFYKIRLLNKLFLEQSKKKWFLETQHIQPPRTFVNFGECQVCHGNATRNKSLPYGWFPRPIYIFCTQFNCSRTIFRNIVQNATLQNIVLLTSPAVKNEEGYCPRSDGSVSDCIFERRWLWNGIIPKIRCMVDVKGSSGVKDISLNDLDPKLLSSYRIVRL